MLRPAVSLMPSVIENHVAVRESTKYSNRKKFLLWSKYVFPYKHVGHKSIYHICTTRSVFVFSFY